MSDRWSDAHSNQESNEDEDFPQDLICGICQDLYLDPRELVPCEHVFCETCLRRLNKARISNCPYCRRQITGTLPVEDLRNQIMETYCQQVQERAEAEQQSNVYSLDLPPTPPHEMPGPLEMITTYICGIGILFCHFCIPLRILYHMYQRICNNHNDHNNMEIFPISLPLMMISFYIIFFVLDYFLFVFNNYLF